jgi:flagellar export protein FliJ
VSARHHEQDRALGSIEKVRGIREQESRVALQLSLDAHAANVAALDAARLLLRQHPGFGHGTAQEFHSHRTLVATMADDIERRRQMAEASSSDAEAARQRWQGDRTRLRAVELLLERRITQRRTDRERREATELDDLAAQGWLRRRTGHANTHPREEVR